MAVQTRTSRVRLTTGTGDWREWTATSNVADAAAGGAIVVTFSVATSGVAPPDPATSTWVELYADTTATLVRSVQLAPGQDVTFYLTSNGLSTGSPRQGTFRVYIRARRNDPATGALIYDVNSDDTASNGSITKPHTETIPTGHTVARDTGYVRATGGLAATISNVSAGGAKAEPAEYGESLYVRLTPDAAPLINYSLNVLVQQPAGTTIRSTTRSLTAGSLGPYDVTFASTVNDAFARSDTAAVTAVTAPNSSLSGQPWTVLTVANDSIRVDPRLNRTDLFQLDDAAWAADPMSKHVATLRRRPDQGGYLTERFTKRRTGTGVNGLAYKTTLTPSKPGTSITDATNVTTTNQGSPAQPGWAPRFLLWESQIPGGAWQKTTTMATGGTTAAGMVVAATPEHFLSVRSLDYQLDALFGSTASRGRHVVPGDALLLGARLEDTLNATFLPADTDADGPMAWAIIQRPNAAGTGTDYLDAAFAWQPAQDASGNAVPKYRHRLPQVAVGTYRMTIPSTATTTWDESDVTFVLRLIHVGAPYTKSFTREVTRGDNQHDRYRPDPLTMLGLPGQR